LRHHHTLYARALRTAVSAFALAACLGMAPRAGAAVLPATPANFAAVFAAAGGGDTIELASGDYGRFSGGAKPATVTIRPAAGAAVTMSVGFSSARNIRIEGVAMGSSEFSGSTSNVTIAGSRFTGQAVVKATGMVNAGIVFDGDTFDAISVGANDYEGRLEVVQSPLGSQPVGVTVTNSHFGGGGESDGIQIGAYGVVVGPGNTFTDLQQGNFGRHVDSIQLYGASHTTIVGNFFRHDSEDIMAPDGGNHEVIVDNVFLHDGGAAIQMGTHSGTTFAHNTVRNTSVNIDAGSTDAILRDNLMINASYSTSYGSGCSNCSFSYDLFTVSGDSRGTNAIVGKPVFVGGDNATTYAGYELAPGSPGKGTASDGSDRGARIVQPPAAPAPAPSGAVAARPRGPSLKLRLAHQLTWAQLRRGVRVHVTAKERVRVRLTLLRTGTKRSLASVSSGIRKAGTRTYRVKPKRARLGRRRAQTIKLRVTITNVAGAKTVRTTTIRVRR
jgi:hypothetical protein